MAEATVYFVYTTQPKIPNVYTTDAGLAKLLSTLVELSGIEKISNQQGLFLLKKHLNMLNKLGCLAYAAEGNKLPPSLKPYIPPSN